MDELLEKLLAKSPTLFTRFRVLRDKASPEKWNRGPAFATKQIACVCGSSELRLATIQKTGTRGFFTKRQVVTCLPPVYVTCPRCARSELLFDPAIHGWDGQAEGRRKSPNAAAVVPFREAKGYVLVNYSYQGAENYADICEEGVPNPEDYFDTFTVYFREQGRDDFEQVVSCECA